ncbi:CBS domain-containing protein [candidate division CSSED10-310 bacterium]|uniref:Zinc metalloprotease n=1 Tax=candidate division CSSED10-310 bacterium TaxID=2855610 RepID=A0ABV6Z377_UNCC1
MLKLHLARIYGIPVRLDYSWFPVLGLLIWSVGGGYIQRLFPWMHRSENWLYGLVAGGLLFCSVIYHEIVLTKRKLAFGMKIKDITLYFFGGSEEIEGEPDSPDTEFKIARAGFLSTLFLILIFGVLTILLPTNVMLLNMLKNLSNYLFTINCLLFLANCLPVFPLDSGRILRAFLWKRYHDSLKAAELTTAIGKGVAYCFLVGGILALTNANLFSGIWLLFFGIFLKQATESGSQYLIIKRSLAGFKVSDIMSQEVIVVHPDLSLQDLTDNILWKHRYQSYPVVSQDTFVGIIRLYDIASIPQEKWPATSVKEVMTDSNEQIVVEPGCDLAKAFYKVTRNKIGRLAVLDSSNHLIGYISLRDISYLLTLKSKT